MNKLVGDSSVCYKWPSKRRRKRLAIVLPASVLRVEQTLLLKTLKSGIIGRAATVYRVDEIGLFLDPDSSKEDLNLIKTILEYQVTPPHLKRKVFPIRRELRYSSLLPPLKIPSHIVPSAPKEGAVLDGFVESCSGGICKVYLGSLGYGTMPKSQAGGAGKIITVKILGVHGEGLKIVRSSWGRTYTGYKVKAFNTLVQASKHYARRGYTVIGTDKNGTCPPESWRILKDSACKNHTAIFFGGPYRGLLEYASPSQFHYILNTIPHQGTESVRTEEAVIATLQALSVICGM